MTRSAKPKASNISIVRQAMPSAWPTRRRLDFCSTMPDGARIALQFVINYEEGAENSILHGDTAAEAFLSEWIGAQPTLGMRNSAGSVWETMPIAAGVRKAAV